MNVTDGPCPILYKGRANSRFQPKISVDAFIRAKVGGISHHQLAGLPNRRRHMAPDTTLPSIMDTKTEFSAVFALLHINHHWVNIPVMQWALIKSGPIIVQLAMAMLALLVVAFAPPPNGRMLLVPLDGQPLSRTMMGEVQATPLKPGPLPGSWVVDGDRQQLAGLWAQHVLVLAAPAAACAEGDDGAIGDERA